MIDLPPKQDFDRIIFASGLAGVRLIARLGPFLKVFAF
jgi:hypothetical protein